MEAVSHQKRTSSTSKHEIYELFSIFVGHLIFTLLDPDLDYESGSGSTDLNPDPIHWSQYLYF
jgi:hypothetical protein